jgi:hypothetical protein
MLSKAIAGIDLAGKDKNPTGICILEGESVEITTLYTDDDILSFAKNCDLFAIDAPLMLLTSKPKIREADRILKRYGAMPPTIMEGLSIRGTALAEALLKGRKEVIEVFPTATAKILGLWEKDYRTVTEKLRIKVKNKHELDAYLCVLTGKLWLEGGAIAVGDEEGRIIIPAHA